MNIIETAQTPSATRVSLFLAEKQIDIERTQIDIRGGDNLTAEFKQLSPNGRIPVLKLDEQTAICESVAICRYFEELYPEKTPLFGQTPLEKAQVEMWQRIVEIQGLGVAFQAFRNITGVYKDRENCVPEWGEESRQRIIDFLPTLETQLADNDFIAGSKFSIADITAYVMVNFIAKLDITITDLPNLSAWFERVAARPAFQA